jgi:hypothetical protein
MLDGFSTTILFILVVTFISAFLRGRKTDKCLKTFNNQPVEVQLDDGNKLNGKFHLERSGFEIKYLKKHELTTNDSYGKSYLIYKSEYASVLYILRDDSALSDTNKAKRLKELNKTYQPNILRRSLRKTNNFLKAIKDSLGEIFSLSLGQLNKRIGVGAILNNNESQLNKLKSDVLNHHQPSFDPLLEHYVGKKVITILHHVDEEELIAGVLKEYTSEFIELMNAEFITTEKSAKTFDVVINRQYGTIRHLAR